MIGARHVVEASVSGIVRGRARLPGGNRRDTGLASGAGRCVCCLRESWLRYVLLERSGAGAAEREPSVQSSLDWPGPQPVRSRGLAKHSCPRHIWRDRRLSRDDCGSAGPGRVPRQRVPTPIPIDQNRAPAALAADGRPGYLGRVSCFAGMSVFDHLRPETILEERNLLYYYELRSIWSSDEARRCASLFAAFVPQTLKASASAIVTQWHGDGPSVGSLPRGRMVDGNHNEERTDRPDR